jgi:hypothetical protein
MSRIEIGYVEGLSNEFDTLLSNVALPEAVPTTDVQPTVRPAPFSRGWMVTLPVNVTSQSTATLAPVPVATPASVQFVSQTLYVHVRVLVPLVHAPDALPESHVAPLITSSACADGATIVSTAVAPATTNRSQPCRIAMSSPKAIAGDLIPRRTPLERAPQLRATVTFGSFRDKSAFPTFRLS